MPKTEKCRVTCKKLQFMPRGYAKNLAVKKDTVLPGNTFDPLKQTNINTFWQFDHINSHILPAFVSIDNKLKKV